MNRSAVEAYQRWKAEKDFIVSGVLTEAKDALEVVTTMEEIFEPNELSTLKNLFDELQDLCIKYSPPKGQTTPAISEWQAEVQTPSSRKERTYEYEKPGSTRTRCEMILDGQTNRGQQCRFTAEEHAAYCKKHLGHQTDTAPEV